MVMDASAEPRWGFWRHPKEVGSSGQPGIPEPQKLRLWIGNPSPGVCQRATNCAPRKRRCTYPVVDPLGGRRVDNTLVAAPIIDEMSLRFAGTINVLPSLARLPKRSR